MLLFSTDLYFNPTGLCLRISSKESACLITSTGARKRQWKEPSPQEHQNRFSLVWDESLKEQMVLFYHELDPASVEAGNWWTFSFFWKSSEPKLSQTLSAKHLLICDLQVHAQVPWLESGQSKGPFFVSAVCSTLQFRYMAKDCLQFFLF